MRRSKQVPSPTFLTIAAVAVALGISCVDLPTVKEHSGVVVTTGSASVVSGITFVQQAAQSTSSRTLSVPLPASTTAGNLLVVGFDFTSASSATVTDNRGNTFTQVGTQLTTRGGARGRLYYARNIAGGSETVTISLSGSSSFLEVYVSEYQGADQSNPLDVTAELTGTSHSATSGSATTTSANDLIFGLCVADASCTVGSGFTARSTYHSNLVEDRVVTSTGAYAATGSSSSAWGMFMAAFRAGAGGVVPVASVSVSPASAAVPVGGTQDLVATTADVNGNVLTGRAVAWSTSNAAVATVASDGTVTGVSAGGPVTITATSEGQSGTASISVTPQSPPPPPPGPYAYPLQVGGGGRYLVDQHGKPFFLSGDAAWSLIGQLSDEDAELYLANRAGLGFTGVLVNLLEHRFATNAPADIYGVSPFTDVPFGTPNEAYFAHADHIIQAAAAQGMVVLLAPDYLGFSCDNEGFCVETKAATTAQLQAWGQYVGTRYRNYDNIIWVIGGDMDPTPVLSKMQALVAGIQAADTRHPFTAHNTRGQMAITPWGGAGWLNVNNTYSDGVTDYAAALTAYAVAPAKPFFLIESAYDGGTASEGSLRYQSYGTVLSGGFGHVYGDCPIWDFNAPNALSFCPGAGSWQSQLNIQGALNMQHLRQLFESRNWATLVPDVGHVAVTAGYGTAGQTDYVPAAYAADGSSIIAYLPTARTVTVSGSRLTGSATMTAWWYNPATGVATALGSAATTGTHTYTPPGNGDWVLVLDGVKFTFPAPGGGPAGPPLTVTSVSVSPSSAMVQAGSSQQFTASATMSDGSTQSSPSVTWTATGGAITTGGAYTAGSTTGNFTVTATSADGPSGSALVTISPPPPPGPPGTVSNLSASAPTDTSVTLSFTQVTDGTGQPASYEIRYARAPITFSTATIVSIGTCTAPLSGTAIGSTLTCLVRGLSPGVPYNFQVAAFRGTYGVNAVFGGASNIAATTTTTLTVVASVVVSPGTATTGVGQTVQLTATPKNSAGTALTGRVVTWSSNAVSRATVNASGLVTGVSAGSAATITASCEGISGTSSVTVTTVTVPVASVMVSPATSSISAGQTAQLSATTRDASGNVLTGRTIAWSTSDASRATVSTSGLVTAVAAGSATITATSEGRSGTASVTVTAASAISFVQAKAVSGATKTFVLSLTSATTQGDLIVVGMDFGSTTFATITDNQGNAFAQVGTEVVSPGGGRVRLYYAKNIHGGAESISVTLAGTPAYVEVYAAEYRGASTTAPLEVSAQAAGSVHTVSSGNAVTTSSNDLIVAYCGADAGCSVGTSFTARSTFNNNLFEDRTVATPGSYAATATATSGWGIVMGAFRR